MSKPHPAATKRPSLDFVELVIESNDDIENSSSLRLIEESDTKSSFKNFKYYLLLLHFMGTDILISSNITITLPSMISTFAQKDYLDISSEELPTFNFYFVNAAIFGNMLGGFLNSGIARKMRMSYFRLILRLLLSVSIVLLLIPNRSLILSVRAIQGFFVGILEPNNFAELIKLTSKKVQGTIGNFLSFYFAIGVMIGEFLYYLSKKDIINWIWVYLILCLIELVSILLSVMYLGVDLSFTEYLERGDERTARQILERYVTSENADYMIKEELAFFEMDRVKRSMHSFAIQAYAREFFVGVLIYFFSVFSFANVYSSSIAILTCKNPKDNQEATDLSYYTTLGGFFEIIGKALQLFVPAFNNKRKRNLIIASASIALLWLINGYFYLKKDWLEQKVLIVGWFLAIGIVISPTVYSVVGDILISELQGLVNSITRIMDMLMLYSFKSVMVEGNDSWKTLFGLSLGFSAIAGIAAILTCIFFFETYGKTKVEIHNILYRIKE